MNLDVSILIQMRIEGENIKTIMVKSDLETVFSIKSAFYK